jgi:hypothetical protein
MLFVYKRISKAMAKANSQWPLLKIQPTRKEVYSTTASLNTVGSPNMYA